MKQDKICNNGMAMGSGFQLKCKIHGRKRNFRTSHFRFWDPGLFLVLLCIFCCAFGVWVLLASGYLWLLNTYTPYGNLIHDYYWNFILRYLLLPSIWVSFCLVEKLLFSSIPRWHACEHKLVNILLTGKELTMQNLQQESPYALGCGSQLLIFAGVMGLIAGLMSFIVPPLSLFLKILFAILCFCQAWLAFIALSLTPFLRFVQLTFLMKEPLPEQYLETLELGLEIIRWRDSMELEALAKSGESPDVVMGERMQIGR